MIGCSTPYREAVDARLAEHVGGPTGTAPEEPGVVLVHCDSAERWQELEAHIASGAVCVAVLAELKLDDYARALSSGASGVVQLDMPSAVTADVIMAAVQGEVVLPRQVAQHLASLAQRQPLRTQLDESEIGLLRELARGATVVELATERFYSERTLRRHLQGVYLKLGVSNRAEAIAAASRHGLLD